MILAASGINHLPMAKQMYFRPIYIIFNSLVLGPAVGRCYSRLSFAASREIRQRRRFIQRL